MKHLDYEVVQASIKRILMIGDAEMVRLVEGDLDRETLVITSLWTQLKPVLTAFGDILEDTHSMELLLLETAVRVRDSVDKIDKISEKLDEVTKKLEKIERTKEQEG